MKSEIKRIEEVSVTMDGEEGRLILSAIDRVLTRFDLGQEESGAMSDLYTSLYRAFMADMREEMKK